MGSIVNITESRALLPVYSTLGATLGRPLDITNNTPEVMFVSAVDANPEKQIGHVVPPGQTRTIQSHVDDVYMVAEIGTVFWEYADQRSIGHPGFAAPVEVMSLEQRANELGNTFFTRAAWPKDAPIPSGGTRNIMIYTGVGGIRATQRVVDIVGDEVWLTVYEGTTYTLGTGTLCPVAPYNRVTQGTHGMAVLQDVAVTSLGTDIGAGIEYLYGASSVPNRTASAIPSGMHKELLPDTNYLVQFHVPASVVGDTRLQYRLDMVRTHE